MTTRPVTSRQPRPRRWGRLRGAWAVLTLLLSAADQLVTAVIGSRPVAVIARRFARPVAAAWRSARRKPVSSLPATTLVYVASPAEERGQ